MQCPNCKRELPEGAVCCPFCRAEVSAKPRQTSYRELVGLFAVIGCILYLIYVLESGMVSGKPSTGAAPPATQAEPSGAWLPAGGNLYTGVELYFGPVKAHVATVLGGSEHYVDPLDGKTYRGLKVRYPDGHSEWKDRSAIATSDSWFVKPDDPALAAGQWEQYDR